MRRTKFTISTFICPNCNKSIPLPRKVSSQREKNHIKDIWCPYCKDTMKFKEVRFNDVYKSFDMIIY